MMIALAKTNQIEKIISQADLAPTTKMQYLKAIRNAIEAGIDFSNPEALATYAQTLCKSSRAFLKSALKLWAKQIELEAKGGATPDNVSAVMATTYRLEALNEAIKVKNGDNGEKAHTWLTQAEVKQLLGSCNSEGLKCQRDKLVLGLLVGSGLRREELANLKFSDIKHQPVGGRIRTVLETCGKGAKNRVVPISDKLAAALDEWKAITGGQGYIARSITKGGHLGTRISAQGIFNIVNEAGKAALGMDDLAPHDLRRSYAQIGYDAGVSITQISKLLGHSSVATTQKYLNLDLDLETTIGDFVPF